MLPYLYDNGPGNSSQLRRRTLSRLTDSLMSRCNGSGFLRGLVSWLGYNYTCSALTGHRESRHYNGSMNHLDRSRFSY
jgi:hypothetical protein